MKVIIVFVSLIYGAFAEKSVSGPYPYAKPQGSRLELPFAPIRRLVATTTQYPTTNTYDYETTTLDLGYLPPTTTDAPEQEPEPVNPLRVQGLPKEAQRQAARFTELDDFKTQFFASQYHLQFGQPKLGQLRVQAQGPAFGRLEVTPNAQNEGYLPPVSRTVNTAEVENVVQSDSQEEQVSDEDSTEQQNQSSEDTSEEGSTTFQDPRFSPNGALNQGQYYILAPDNTLQKVMFHTAQTEDDIRSRGFTAQLQYSPVEPVQPPVYGYNEQGQLVRILRKK